MENDEMNEAEARKRARADRSCLWGAPVQCYRKYCTGCSHEPKLQVRLMDDEGMFE